MHTTHALPSHFGRSTVIASDHQELAGMLDELARLCSALEVELEGHPALFGRDGRPSGKGWYDRR